MKSVVLVTWVCLTLIVAVAVIWERRRRGKQFLNLTQFISLIIAVSSVISSCNLLYKALTLQALIDLLGPDIVILILGAIAVIWVSAKEVWKLL